MKTLYEQNLLLRSNRVLVQASKRISWLFTALALWLTTSYVQAQNFPDGFSQQLVANGFNQPNVIAFAPDGRVFVAEQGGALRVIKNGSLLTAPFVGISVDSEGERGLIGLTLDPNFASNQYVYVYYTVPSTPRHNRVSRFTANGDVAVSGSELVLLDLDPLSATNHNGGSLSFGKDGKLYVGVGENAVPTNAQTLENHLGKILRINADGSIPTDNPFPTGSLSRQRIWAYGLRNPYTIAIQPGTGKIFVNDVGQNTYEEINDATTGGLNFGWPNAEGSSSNPAYNNPLFSYPHGAGDGSGCAITGGTFFNPPTTNYPTSFVGRYFYQDLCNQWINVIDVSGSGATRAPFGTGLAGLPVGLSTGLDGNLYYLSLSDNALYRIIYTPATPPPTTDFTIAGVTQVSCETISAGQRRLTFSPQYTGLTGQPVSFSVSNELVPTTNPGPYILNLYTDNPTITLKATQTGTATAASFAYNWLPACSGGTAPNTAPTVANPIPDQPATVGQAFSFGIPANTFTDAQTPNGLTLQVNGLPAGLNFSAPSTISGTPSVSGVSEVTVTATDPGNLSVSTVFRITVSPVGTPPPPPAGFAITGVTQVRCEIVSAGQRRLTFNPQYTGLTGQPVSFSVSNELVPTTNPGPYILNLYTDNPTITLKAIQTGTAGEASFAYNWLSVCTSPNTRLGASDPGSLRIMVLGNPVENNLTVEVWGVNDQSLLLQLVNERGHFIETRRVDQSQDGQFYTFDVSHQPTGMLLLQASTPTQRNQVKIIRK
ncbi:PQQ-dependent sugar dehydrogenase [Spirosoma spitsbergense]|uniref:PQQ-dependent sugar dehydrogenase n=1 Tax=Spirosoma spitsbergense TaxID=431554 RepID=UPI000376B68A|nr:PQQ-dependent sugar dehydrogenase [Spirosoma spitsbergense]